MGENAAGRTPRVLVGVDGSAAAKEAVAFAAGEAALRGATLVAVMSVELPDYAWIDPYGIDRHSEADHLATAEQRLRQVLAEAGGQDVPVEVVVTVTPAPAALIGRSADADLLVVGSRGRGGFRGLVLGSVSMQCVLHAHCPVTVVRPEPRPAEAEHARTLADVRRDTTATFI